MPQVVAHLDRGLAIRHRDVHVASADALLVGKHAETLADPAVPLGVGDGNATGTVGGAPAAITPTPTSAAAAATTDRNRVSSSRRSATAWWGAVAVST